MRKKIKEAGAHGVGISIDSMDALKHNKFVVFPEPGNNLWKPSIY
jgi:hypothetical protein